MAVASGRSIATIVRARVTKHLLRHDRAIAAEMVAAVRARSPWYAQIRDAALLEDFHETSLNGVRTLARWIRTGGSAASEEKEDFRVNAQRRADQLIPLGEYIEAMRISQSVVWDHITAAAGDDPAEKAATVEILSMMVDVGNMAIATVAESYLAEQQQLAADTDRAKRDVVEDLLAGRLPLREGATLVLTQLGFDPDGDFELVVGTVADPGQHAPADALRAVADAVTRHLRGAPHAPLVVVRHEEVVAMASPQAGLRGHVDAARSALRSTLGIDLVAGIGTVCHGLSEIQRGYEEAHRAMRLARSPDAGVVSLDGMPLFDYLVSQADQTARRIAPAEIHELLTENARLGGILLETLHAYIDADLNVGRAAAALVVHPNTVHYRLRRISEVTGRNTRSFTDLVDLLCAVRVLAQAPAGSG
jgi:hypothetical protein